jgi:4-hydroxybenzoate polyprenyltransferase
MWQCFSNKIYVVYLPPHTSHILQPLDLGVFASLKVVYKAEADLLNFYTENTVSGKQLFLFCYRKGREKALKESNVLIGWRASGLWPVNMAKPLLSIQLLENTKKAAARAKMDDTTRKRRIELVTPVPISIKKVVLSTPRASREIRTLHGFFDEGNHSIATQRLLFRKVEKGYDEKDWQLKMALRENELLKARLEAMAPVKRKKVETSPNSRFVNIRAIRRAQIAAGAIEAESADEEGSEKSETPESCIVVGSDEDSDDVEVEG